MLTYYSVLNMGDVSLPRVSEICAVWSSASSTDSKGIALF